MEIIAHRGYWVTEEEWNQYSAFKRAWENDFGSETDIRDFEKAIKISHNMATKNSLDAEDFFYLYKNSEYVLAINIKADGLQLSLKKILEMYNIQNYFCFDMSIPDTIGYLKEQINFFVRESEYEPITDLYHQAAGVWMDGFESDAWITYENILEHVQNKKKVCIVSPELHGRKYRTQWESYNRKEILENSNIILCTDYPQEARDFFYGKN